MAFHNLPKSRNEAKALGVTQYFNGNPCPQGHVAPRYTGDGICMVCRRTRHTEYQRQYLADPQRKAARSSYYTARAKTPKGRAWRVEYRAKRRAAIAGRPKPEACEVCNRTDLKLAFDHCHLTGAFRGWLCTSCNLTIGRMRENPAALRALADYIEQHNAKLVQGDLFDRLSMLRVLDKSHAKIPATN